MHSAMNVEIRREDDRSLPAYASIPIAFAVREVVDVAGLQLHHSALPTRAVTTPWEKNYDTIADNDPMSWSTRFDVRSWIYLASYLGEERVGGAIVVAERLAVGQLDGRLESAILWDVRVRPDWRRRGIGRQLLAAAADVARETRCRVLDVETQDINAAACRLYSATGFTLAGVTAKAYPDAPHEIRLLWSKQLL